MELVFHLHGHAGSNTMLSPSAYYISGECTPVAVRLYAGTAPDEDAEFDILDDGETIFGTSEYTTVHNTTGVITEHSSVGYPTLMAGETSEVTDDNFNDNIIEEESWITCQVRDTGNGRDFTVILELESND